MHRTYRLRLRPTSRQRETLAGILALSCDLYNAALQERRDAWKLQHKRIGYQDQTRSLTELRAEDDEVRAMAVDVAPKRRQQMTDKHSADEAFEKWAESDPEAFYLGAELEICRATWRAAWEAKQAADVKAVGDEQKLSATRFTLWLFVAIKRRITGEKA